MDLQAKKIKESCLPHVVYLFYDVPGGEDKEISIISNREGKTDPRKKQVQLCEYIRLMGLLAETWVTHGQLHHHKVSSQSILPLS